MTPSMSKEKCLFSHEQMFCLKFLQSIYQKRGSIFFIEAYHMLRNQNQLDNRCQLILYGPIQ